MPIFAYRCRSCGEEFQTLVMSGETPVCRSCRSANLEQQVSLIASPAKGGDTLVKFPELDRPGCRRCHNAAGAADVPALTPKPLVHEFIRRCGPFDIARDLDTDVASIRGVRW